MFFLRIFSYIVLSVVILFFPWWFAGTVLFLFFCFFKKYYEGIFFAFMYDLLFSVPVTHFWGSVHVVFFTALIVFVFIENVRKRLL